MKGYIFALSGQSAWLDYASRGLFGTREKPVVRKSETRPRWLTSLAAFADYSTMAPGDRVFFFKERLIYGIGRIIRPYPNSPSATLLNYQDSLDPEAISSGGDPMLIADPAIRVVVPFVPDPQLFSRGLDMDEVLASPEADSAWGLRFWSGASFKQLGEMETRMLIRAFERRFANLAGGPDQYKAHGPSESDVLRLVGEQGAEPFSMHRLVVGDPSRYVDGSRIRQEETLHGLLAESLTWHNIVGDGWQHPDALDSFHEMPASPPKPAGREDSIDVVCTRRYPGSDLEGMAVHFDVVEAKLDRWDTSITYAAAMTQLMKYVDFVSRYHVGGNYGAVTARYVAARYSSDDVSEHKRAVSTGSPPVGRSYVLNPREDPPTQLWKDSELWRYRWTGDRLDMVRLA